jgi:cytoplasmic iron level regulating protein YaaA (DUF328/UPF0246 family)
MNGVRILLPPSEGKTFPSSGPVLNLQQLSYPELTAARCQVLEALIEVSARDDAAEILKVGKRIMPEVVAQRDIIDMPCAPAREIYTGVLYQAAQLHSNDDVMIFSGLFGVTTAEDLIPAYRLSMNTSLPRIGSLKTFWRRELAKAGFDRTNANKQHCDIASKHIDSDTITTVDMRSGGYQVTAAWGQWWDLRVLDSRGKVITHAAKHYRGLLTRALLDAEHITQQEHNSTPSRTDQHKTNIDVAQVAHTLGHVEITHNGSRHHITLRLD